MIHFGRLLHRLCECKKWSHGGGEEGKWGREELRVRGREGEIGKEDRRERGTWRIGGKEGGMEGERKRGNEGEGRVVGRSD